MGSAVDDGATAATVTEERLLETAARADTCAAEGADGAALAGSIASGEAAVTALAVPAAVVVNAVRARPSFAGRPAGKAAWFEVAESTDGSPEYRTAARHPTTPTTIAAPRATGAVHERCPGGRLISDAGRTAGGEAAGGGPGGRVNAAIGMRRRE